MRAGMSVHGGCGRSPYVNWEIKNERMKRYIFCISLCLGVVSGGRAAAQEPPAEPEAAVAYGYRWPLGKNWSVEATAALGYLRSDYDRYVWKKCGRHLGRGHKNYFGPTKVGVSFGFTIR